MQKSFLLFILVLLVKPPNAGAAIGPSGDCSALTVTPCTVLRAVNVQRDKFGLKHLMYDSHCQAMAQSHAYDMARNGFFSHTSPYRGTFAERAKFYSVKGYVGENIAYGWTLDAVVGSWMNSPGHRENILDTHYDSTGIGFAKDSSGRPYYVQCFTGSGH
jgi:uncharacterized protein YkwD